MIPHRPNRLPAPLRGMACIAVLLLGLPSAHAWQDAPLAQTSAPETPKALPGGEESETPEGSQPTPVAAPELPEPPTWPGVPELAVALSQPALRTEALLTLAVLSTLPELPRATSQEEGRARATTLLGQREWLDQLVARYGYGEPRSPVLDPAAWQVRVQLDRAGLLPTLMASPLGPGPEVLAGEVFDRDSPDIAAATLPELLWSLEAGAPLVWARAERRFADDPWLAVALAEIAPTWFEWPAAAPASADSESAAEGTEGGYQDPRDVLLAEGQESLTVLYELAMDVGPPDPARLAELRRSLLTVMPELGLGQRARASGLLHLAGLVEALYQGDYLHVAESLLAVTARLQDEALFYPEDTRAFAAWLTGVLPGLSATYGRAFSSVDPQLNSVIATAYDVARALARETSREDLASLRLQIANAVAGLALMIPDLGYYFDQPIRDPIAGGVDACTGIAGRVDEDGNPALTRELFDDCQETLLDLANFEAREAQLAGDSGGPFGPSQLQRELGLTAGQRINYGVGYLHDRYDTGCELPTRPLPNPLEWAYLATFMVWFAEQSPVYFQAPENALRLESMRGIGRELIREIAEQVDCFGGAGAVLNDPVDRVTTDYREELRELGRGLASARAAFRAERLAPGSDLRLDAGAEQSTAYRPAELPIGPCDPAEVCEMSGQLSSTRALTGLFGDRWLLADQAGMGHLEICYGDMGWVDRRMEPVRPGDENVANFFGRLAFELKGRYREGEEVTELFAFRFSAPEESHYLFAAQDPAVLEDACPVEWVGTRIVTELPEGRSAIVPNRLTYLSAARTLPSRLLETNWDQGAEWRDWFVTGLGVERLDVPTPPDIGPRLGAHLQALYRAEQAALYGALASPGDGPEQLFEELNQVSTSKMLLRTQMMLFFPHILIHSDGLREAVAGQGGLLDRRMVLAARQQDLPVDLVMAGARERTDTFRENWRSLPETVRRRGSIADSVAHAMIRLNAVHDQYFAAPPQAPARSVPPLSRAASEGDEVDEAEGDL